MNAYLPTAPFVVVVVFVAVAAVLVLGFALGSAVGRGVTGVGGGRGDGDGDGDGGVAQGPALRMRLARALCWTTLVAGTFGIERVVAHEPPGVRMVALIVFALLMMKVIVVVEERALGMRALTIGEWLAFSCTWLGMRPRLFVERARTSTGPVACVGGGALVRRGARHIVIGLGLVALARSAWVHTREPLLVTVLLMPALSLIVHFGVCHVMAGAWRQQGVACEALFRAPLRSQNLSEFWARRWNLAFSEMTATAAYRPLSSRLGRGPALVAAFALSGLLHEMAISVPVGAGYGLPLAYFVVHGSLVLVERAIAHAGQPLSGWVGRTWAIFWVVAPLPLLFHEAFLTGLILPLVGATGASPR